MQQFGSVQNNRLDVPQQSTSVHCRDLNDSTEDSFEEHMQDDIHIKPDYSISSTVDSRRHSPATSHQSEGLPEECQESLEVCPDWMESGQCVEGDSCCFSHIVRRAGLRRGQLCRLMLQRFPQLVCQGVRVKSFLE